MPTAKSSSSKQKPKSKLKGKTESLLKKQIERVAKEKFGFTSFRPGQMELIEAAMAGRDSIGIMPTGSGKSLCFQLPSLLLEKTVVVISPLISLMHDQESHLIDLGIPVAKVNSTLSKSEENEVREQIEDNVTEVVYVTPERLENEEYLDLLKDAGVSLIVIDEAHCISQWGHDFRPAYTALHHAIKELGSPPVMALTATATDDVLTDIIKQLALREPLVVKQGVDRPNLLFEVFNTVNDQLKNEKLIEIIESNEGSGIVYVATVKAANEVADWLVSKGVSAAAYHAKLSANKRTEMQEAFMADEFKVIVATKAFGMGIDKPNIRFIVHYQFPDSLESYYQEAGRAGRDGSEARITLLYKLEDRRIQSYFLGGKYPSRDEVSEFLFTLRETLKQNTSLTVTKFAELCGIALKKTRVIANYLDAAGVIKKSRGIKVVKEFDDKEQLDKFLTAYEQRHLDDRSRLDQMMHYAQSLDCRVKLLREYFGETDPEKCGRCDNCTASPFEIPSSIAS